MAINPNATRLIQVTPDRYQGVSPFQERALIQAQQKIDKYNTDLSTEYKRLGQEVNASSNDIDKTAAVLDQMKNDFSGLRANRLQDVSGTAEKFQNFVAKYDNSPEIQILNERKANEDAFKTTIASLEDRDIYSKLATNKMRQSDLFGPDGTANSNPMQDIIVSNPLDVTTASQALLKGLQPDITSSADGASINVGGYNIPLIQQGDTKVLDEGRLYDMIDGSIKNSAAYQTRMADYDQRIENAEALGMDPVQIELQRQEEIQRYEAQARTMAKGTSYTQEGFRFSQLDMSELPGGGSGNGNVNQDDLNNVLVDKITTRIPLENNPYLTKDPDEFEEVYSKVDSELSTLVDGVTFTVNTPTNSIKGELRRNESTGMYNILDNPNLMNTEFSDKDGQPLTPDAKNELISTMIRYDNLTAEKNSLMDKARKELSIGDDAYNQHKDFISGGLKEKASILDTDVTTLQSEYDTYQNEIESANKINQTSPRGDGPVIDKIIKPFDEWINDKYQDKTNINLNELNSTYKNLFEKERANDVENIDFTFKDLVSKSDLGEKRFSGMHPDIQNAIFQDKARQETYDVSGYSILENASSVIDGSGKKVDLNDNNILLREEREDGTLGEAVAVTNAKYTSLGYAVNPKNGNIVEAVQIDVLDEDKKDQPLKQIVYVESENLNKLGAVIKGYGNSTKVAEFLNTSLNKNVNPLTNQKDYFEDGAQASVTLSKRDGQYTAIFTNKATGETSRIQNKNIGPIVSAYQGFMYLNDTAQKSQEESLGK